MDARELTTAPIPFATAKHYDWPYTCRHCGKSFSGRKRQFCSDDCAAEAKRQRDKKRKIANRTSSKPLKPRRNPNPIIDGMRVCLVCSENQPVSEYRVIKDPKCKSGETITGYCNSCEKKRAKLRTTEQRRQERARIAARKGKTYVDREKLDLVFFEKQQERLAQANAYQAWRWWLTQAPDSWIAAYYKAKGEPWANPRLSESERYRVRYRASADFNLKERVRRQHTKKAKRDGVQELIRGALRRNGTSNRVEELCGYSIAELRQHIERQFTKGMTWDRFMSGEIHIDHIVPQKSFDLQDDTEWRACWSLTNLRPMWAKDNLEKRDRVLYLL
jgi:hypothetical protein